MTDKEITEIKEDARLTRARLALLPNPQNDLPSQKGESTGKTNE